MNNSQTKSKCGTPNSMSDGKKSSITRPVLETITKQIKYYTDYKLISLFAKIVMINGWFERHRICIKPFIYCHLFF